MQKIEINFSLGYVFNQRINAMLSQQEVIVMVGYPGSGKSTASKQFEEDGYVVLHGDELKTSAK